MSKQPPEAEIISQPEGYHYKEQYQYYSTSTKSASPFAWIVTMMAFVFSIIPFVGFIFAIFALIVAIIKKVPIILPLIALAISGAVTGFVISIVWLLQLIF